MLALQGAFREHKTLLESLGATVREVRLPQHLTGLGGLVIPGGESTVIGKLMEEYGLMEAIQDFYASGAAVYGSCAGAILLAREVLGAPPQFGTQPALGLLDMTVQRNAFGRQIDSFDVPLEVRGLTEAFPAAFIRAPVIVSVGEGVEVLSTYQPEHHPEQIVLVRQERLLASSFHPELTRDPRIHQLFLGLME